MDFFGVGELFFGVLVFGFNFVGLVVVFEVFFEFFFVLFVLGVWWLFGFFVGVIFVWVGFGVDMFEVEWFVGFEFLEDFECGVLCCF